LRSDLICRSWSWYGLCCRRSRRSCRLCRWRRYNDRGSHYDWTFSGWRNCSRSGDDWWAGNNWAGWRSAGDGRSRSRGDNVCSLARKWNDSAWSRRGRCCLHRCCRRRYRGRNRRRCNHTWRRGCNYAVCRGRRHDGSGTWRRCGLGGGFGLLALEDGLQGVARFGDLGEVELRL